MVSCTWATRTVETGSATSREPKIRGQTYCAFLIESEMPEEGLNGCRRISSLAQWTNGYGYGALLCFSLEKVIFISVPLAASSGIVSRRVSRNSSLSGRIVVFFFFSNLLCRTVSRCVLGPMFVEGSSNVSIRLALNPHP